MRKQVESDGRKKFKKYDKKSIKSFIDEIYSQPPKKIYPTNKTDVCQVDHIRSLDISDLKISGLKTIEVIEMF